MERIKKEIMFCDANRLVLYKQEEKKGGEELDDLSTWLWLLDLVCKILEKINSEGKKAREIWSGHITTSLGHRKTATMSKIFSITLSAKRSDLRGEKEWKWESKYEGIHCKYIKHTMVFQPLAFGFEEKLAQSSLLPIGTWRSGDKRMRKQPGEQDPKLKEPWGKLPAVTFIHWHKRRQSQTLKGGTVKVLCPSHPLILAFTEVRNPSDCWLPPPWSPVQRD